MSDNDGTLPDHWGGEIDARELERMLLDPDVPEETLRPYLMVSPQDSRAFEPVVTVNPDRIAAGPGAIAEAAMALSSLNGVARFRRLRRYRRKLCGWQGLRLVSEGDSWFQFPFLLTDVIDWLSDPYAILSLDAAGDLISDMVRQGELLTAVVAEKPHAVLLSGGGNDLLGGANLARAVVPFAPDLAAEEYLQAGFDANLAAVLAGYRQLLDRLHGVAPDTPVLCHVYDHALPNKGRWLGAPLQSVGIVDPALQRDIVRAMVNRFHGALIELARQYPQVRVVDTRGAVRGRWYDELHPNDAGYAAVAQLFADAIADATDSPQAEIGPDAGIESAGVRSRGPDLSAYADAALLAEVGRRRLLRGAGDPAAREPLLIFPSSLSGDRLELREAGAAALAEGAARTDAEAALIDELRARAPAAGAFAIGRPAEAPTPSAERLLSRLTLPTAGGLEAAVEAAPDLERAARLDEAERVLKRLAEGADDVDETVIDRLIREAENALRKLQGDGPDAALDDSEVLGLEAVIEVDGSRPVLFVQDGTIDLDAPELQGALSERWRGSAAAFLPGIRRVASAVGAVQLPAFDTQRLGTAFAIAPGLVLTNRHVLEEIAKIDGAGWRLEVDAEIDFVGEHERTGENRFRIVEVLRAGANPINRMVNFANADYAVLRVEGAGAFPRPLSFEVSVDRVRVGAAGSPPIYVMGFPAKPWVAKGTEADGPPRPGREFEEVLERLFANRFGSKRWAPGLVEAGAGQLSGDASKWVMSHDASTLGGSSGSCVIDFAANDGERVVGLHFGGRPRVENYAHIVAALQQELAAVDGIAWI